MTVLESMIETAVTAAARSVIAPCNTVHPPVVIDYCIQRLRAMSDELDESGCRCVHVVLLGVRFLHLGSGIWHNP